MKKIKISLNAKEEKLILEALNEKRSNQIKENRPIEPVNDLIFKLIKKSSESIIKAQVLPCAFLNGT